MTRYLLATLAILAAPATAKDTVYPASPETIICPPSAGDLDYAFNHIMESAKFQENPHGGPNSWRRRIDGPFHAPSLMPAEWMSVDFKRFDTAAGTRIVADLRYQTRRYEFGVKEQGPYSAIQDVLDGLSTVYPCVDDPAT